MKTIIFSQGLAVLYCLPFAQQRAEKLRSELLYAKMFRMALPYSRQLQGQIANVLQFIYRHDIDYNKMRATEDEPDEP